jgi:hypothetical protein
MYQDIRPKWWQVYLTFPLLIALFLLDNHLKLSLHEHQAVQIGILLFVYGLIHLWLKANEAALSKMDQRKFHGTVTVIQIPPHQLPNINVNKRPLIQLPASEIQGMLGNTFDMDYIDMDYIDAESSPVDEVRQELNKE